MARQQLRYHKETQTTLVNRPEVIKTPHFLKFFQIKYNRVCKEVEKCFIAENPQKLGN